VTEKQKAQNADKITIREAEQAMNWLKGISANGTTAEDRRNALITLRIVITLQSVFDICEADKQQNDAPVTVADAFPQAPSSIRRLRPR
jgi:hypothetical protein